MNDSEQLELTDVAPLTKRYGETDGEHARRVDIERHYVAIGRMLAPFDAIDEIDFEEPEEYDD